MRFWILPSYYVFNDPFEWVLSMGKSILADVWWLQRISPSFFYSDLSELFIMLKCLGSSVKARWGHTVIDTVPVNNPDILRCLRISSEVWPFSKTLQGSVFVIRADDEEVQVKGWSRKIISGWNVEMRQWHSPKSICNQTAGFKCFMSLNSEDYKFWLTIITKSAEFLRHQDFCTFQCEKTQCRDIAKKDKFGRCWFVLPTAGNAFDHDKIVSTLTFWF